MKRWFYGVLALCLTAFCASAFAQEALASRQLETAEGVAWLSFNLPEGAEAIALGAEALPQAPEGLEALYDWFTRKEGQEAGLAQTWVVSMANRRVLTSATRTEVGVALAPEDLLTLWPEMVYKLGTNAMFVNDEEASATVGSLNGVPCLKIDTMAVLDGESMVSVLLEGYAYAQEGVLVEVWVATPAQATYLYEETSYQQLLADMDAAQQWLGSIQLLPEGLSLPGAESWEGTQQSVEEPYQGIRPSEQTIRYIHPKGYFFLEVPENCIVIDPDEAGEKAATAQEDVEDEGLRALYLMWLDLASQAGDTLLVSPNYDCAMMIAMIPGQNIGLAEMQALQPGAEALLSSLLDDFVTYQPLTSMNLGGQEYWVLSYGGAYEKQPMYVVLMVMSGQGKAPEVDMWFREDAISTPWDSAFSLMIDSLVFLDAPEEEP